MKIRYLINFERYFSECFSNFTNIFSTGTVNCVKFEQTPLLIANLSGEAQINCKHDDSSLAVMLWYQQLRTGMSLDLIGYGYTGSPPNFESRFTDRFTQTRQDTVMGSLTISNLILSDSAIYYCAASGQAVFGNGTKLTVLERDISKPEVEILKPSGNETSCKQKVTLVCVAKNFYPDHVSITWKIGSKDINDDVATDPYATQDKETKLFSITSRLKVSKKEFKPQNTFRCTVRFYNETDVYTESKTI
uniref:Ig-like domain-containing protein n=1 Tax=Sinocyclocheilus grahami TaxID=75366 RepID=A0A672QIV2_SINGR